MSFLTKTTFAQTATPSATLIPIPTPLSLTISNLPSQITAGQQFNIVLNLHAKINLNYQFKVYGGVNGDNYSYEVKNGDTWTNGYNGAWNSLPQSSTDSNGNSSLELTVRFKTDKTSGTSQLIAKVKESAFNNYIVSNAYSLDVVDPSPTPINTPVATTVLTNSPTLTPTPTPTKIPTPTIKLTLTPTPKIATISAIIEATETTEATETPTITIISTSGEILGESISTKSATKKNFLPLIFIVSGGILLLTPLIISKIKKQ